MLGDTFFLIFSNMGSLILGYIFGRVFRWKRVRTARGVVVYPWVSKIRGHDVLILLLAGMAVMTTYQTVLSNSAQEEVLQAQLVCNEGLEEAVKLREESAKRYVTIVNGLVESLVATIGTDADPRSPQYRAGLLAAFERYQVEFDAYMEQRPVLYNRDPNC
jgi:hypothetical protein